MQTFVRSKCFVNFAQGWEGGGGEAKCEKRKFPTLLTKVVACFSALKHIYTSWFAIAFYSLLTAISFVVHTNFSAFTCCCGKWYFMKVAFLDKEGLRYQGDTNTKKLFSSLSF